MTTPAPSVDGAAARGVVTFTNPFVILAGVSVVVAGVAIEAVSGAQPTAAALDWTLYGLAAFIALVGVVVIAATPRHRTP